MGGVTFVCRVVHYPHWATRSPCRTESPQQSSRAHPFCPLALSQPSIRDADGNEVEVGETGRLCIDQVCNGREVDGSGLLCGPVPRDPVTLCMWARVCVTVCVWPRVQAWPSIMRTLYKDHDRYVKGYFSDYKNTYFSGDGAYKVPFLPCLVHVFVEVEFVGQDADGYIWIVGRLDDVMNISGHRISTVEVGRGGYGGGFGSRGLHSLSP